MTGAQRFAEFQQRILLVDDDEDDYILTRGMLLDLNRAKFQLDWASTYAAGLEQMLNGGYDAALVDYDLGAQKGPELIEAALAGGCQTPMIVFTGRGSYEIDVLAMQSGAVDYINKSEASPALLERSIRYAIERKQAERALAAANEQLQRQKLDVERTNNHLQGLFDHAPAGLALFDPRPPYRALAHNQVYQRDFPEPYAAQGMLGLTLPEFAVTADADGLLAIFDEVVHSGQAKTFYSFAYNGHAGRTIWWNGHLSPVFQEGRLVALAHTTINVTEQVEASRQLEAELRERLQAEKALQAALARAEEGQRTLEAVMQNVPVGIILTGPPPDFTILQVSRHVTELTGRPLERLVGLPGGKHQDAWRILLSDGVSRPADADLALWRAAHQGEAVHNQEMMVVGARGRRIPVLVSAAPIRDRHGQTVAAIAVFHDITERKQAEQQLRREREQLQTLVDRIPVMLTFYDPGLQMMYFNREFERLTGWTTADAQTPGLDLMTRFYPDPAYRQEVEEYMASLEEGWRDFDVTAKDGSLIRSSWSNIRLSDDTQIGIGIDLRERLKAEQALAESEAVLRGLFESDSVLAGIIELDGDDLKYVIANPKLADFYGQTPETLAGRYASELGLEEGALESWVQIYRQCLNAHSTVKSEYPVIYQGKETWHLGTFSQIPSGPSGLPRFALLVVDITERKQFEQALHLSEERFRLASRATTGVIYDWDLVTDEVYQSEGLLRVVGYAPGQEPRAGQRWWPANIHPEDSERIQRELQAALDGDSDSVAYEYRIRHADGHWVEIWDQAYIARDEQGWAVRLIGTCTDISERKRWEATTRQQNAVLDAINRIFQEALTTHSEEELGETCLAVAGELTRSTIGFIGEINPGGQMHALAISATGWEACALVDGQGKRRLPGEFEIHGLYGKVLREGRSLLTNDPASHPDRIGLPPSHAPLTAFLSVPLVQGGQTIGLLAVANRPGGYSDTEREALEALAPAVVEALTRKRTELALRESEERFRIALANTPVVIYSMDRELRYTWIYNPRHAFTAEGTIGKRDADLLEPESARILSEIKQQVLATGQGIHREVAYTIRGAPVVYDLTIEPLYDESGAVSGLIAAAMDITHARQIETEIRSATDRLEIQRQILTHREQERMQIARDLHDGLLQELIGLTYMLREGLDIAEKEDRLAKFTEIMAVIQGQIQEVRAFCSTLRPPTLMPFGLERAINQFAANQMEKYPEPKIELDLAKDRRSLPEELRMALFRIVQESINNARKHAQASCVQVRFTFDEREILLEIQDDGVGFHVPDNWLTLSRQGHLGLVGIHERAEAVGGRLQVISAPGKGTRVCVTVPRTPQLTGKDPS